MLCTVPMLQDSLGAATKQGNNQKSGGKSKQWANKIAGSFKAKERLYQGNTAARLTEKQLRLLS